MMVSPDAKNSSIKMYHGPIEILPPPPAPQAPFGLGAHLEVVVDHGHLAVQHEVRVRVVGLDQGQQGVDQVDQVEAKLLVGLVPLPVPVGVGDNGNSAGGHARQTMAWRTNWRKCHCCTERSVSTSRARGRRHLGRGMGAPLEPCTRRHRTGRRWGGEVVYTNAELAERSALGAGALARSSVRSGDRVLWCCTATPDSVIALLAVLRLGAVLVPCNPASTPSELAFVVRDVAPSAAVLEHDQHRRAVHEADTSVHCVDPAALAAPPSTARSSNGPALDRSTPFDATLIVYTSGTTGTPKGAVHTHASLLAGSRSVGDAWAISAADRLILALPLFHVHGLCVGLLTMLAAGASVTLFERFAPAAVAGAAATIRCFSVSRRCTTAWPSPPRPARSGPCGSVSAARPRSPPNCGHTSIRARRLGA